MAKTRIVTLKEKYYSIHDIERAKISLCEYLDVWIENNKQAKILGISFSDNRLSSSIAEINMIISEEETKQ